MLKSNQKILVVDDDKEIWSAYKKVLEYKNIPETSTGKQLAALLQAGSRASSTADSTHPHFDLSFASQGQQGYEMLVEETNSGSPFSVAFVDIRMPPGWDGMKTAAKIREFDPNIEIVIVTAYTDRSREEIVKAVGTPEKLLFLRKPFDPEEIFQLALSLSEKWRLSHLERKARKALEESESRFRSLVETTPDFVWEIDLEGKFTYCSPVCEMIYGFRPDELLGTKVFEKLLCEEEADGYRKSFEAGVEKLTFLAGPKEYCCQKKDGETVYIESSAVPIIEEEGALIGYRGIDRDITQRINILAEKKSIEEQFRQSQKMEAIGTLAGGMAHDLNNLLTPIIGYTELSLMETDKGSQMFERLKVVTQSAKKAAELIGQILVFSRKKSLNPESFEINMVINDCVKMLTRMIREDIDLRFDLADNTWPIFIDKGQAEQVLINLVVNARDAINDNGKIVVNTKNVSISEGQELTDVGKSNFSGDYVVLSVSDNGSGIEQEVIGRMFDPFFTTKEVGKGTGLGLATVYGVTYQHDGHVVVESTPGEGTTFSVYLPRSSKEVRPVSDPEDIPIVGGDETILVVEDDLIVRELTVSLLEQIGYNVLHADNGVSAVEEFKDASDEIDLVVSDVVMPQRGGGALADKIREINPNVPIIFVSGYARDMAPSQIMESPNMNYCQKPYNTNIFTNMIRTMLDKNKEGSANS